MIDGMGRHLSHAAFGIESDCRAICFVPVGMQAKAIVEYCVLTGAGREREQTQADKLE